MVKILVVEDDLEIQDSISCWLRAENHVVDTASDGTTGLDLLLHYSYDVAILDWQLPGLEGAEICARVRAAGKTLPILMLTSRSALSDRITGLDAGAFDYVVKPCVLDELSARVRALLRRGSEQKTEELRVGDLIIDCVSRQVKRGAVSLEISPSEFEILKLLASVKSEGLSAEAILARLWHDKPQVSVQLVRVHIMNLRKKLLAAGSVVSVDSGRNTGYRLSAAGEALSP